MNLLVDNTGIRFLNWVLFSTLTERRAEIDPWEENDHRHRPHPTFGSIPPLELAMKVRREMLAAKRQKTRYASPS